MCKVIQVSYITFIIVVINIIIVVSNNNLISFVHYLNVVFNFAKLQNLLSIHLICKKKKIFMNKKRKIISPKIKKKEVFLILTEHRNNALLFIRIDVNCYLPFTFYQKKKKKRFYLLFKFTKTTRFLFVCRSIVLD